MCFSTLWVKKRFICGIIFLAVALYFLPSISLPFIPWVYIVETSFNGNNPKQEIAIGSTQRLTQIRLGIWGACYYSQKNSDCLKGFAYRLIVSQNKSRITVVETSKTSGLLLSLFATGFTCAAFLLTRFLRHHRKLTLFGVYLAVAVSAMAIFAEIALYDAVKNKTKTLGAGAVTHLGSGFYLTLTPFFLLLPVFLWLLWNYKRKPSGKYLMDDDSSTAQPEQSDEPDQLDDDTEAKFYKFNNPNFNQNEYNNRAKESTDDPTQQQDQQAQSVGRHPAQPAGGDPIQPGYPTQQTQPQGQPHSIQQGSATQQGQPQPIQPGYPTQQTQPQSQPLLIQQGYPTQQGQLGGYPTPQTQPQGQPHPIQQGYPTQQGQPHSIQPGYPTQQTQIHPIQQGYPTQQGQLGGYPTSQTQTPNQIYNPPQTAPNPSNQGYNQSQTLYNQPQTASNPSNQGYNQSQTFYNQPQTAPNPSNQGYNQPPTAPNPSNQGYYNQPQTPPNQGYDQPQTLYNPPQTAPNTSNQVQSPSNPQEQQQPPPPPYQIFQFS